MATVTDYPPLPATAPAVVAHGKDDLRIEEVALTPTRPDQAVIDIAYGGICGSDLHYWLHGAAGESILKDPMVLGHEVVGTVVRAAADGTGPDVGTSVAVHPATLPPALPSIHWTGPTCPGVHVSGQRSAASAHRWCVPALRKSAHTDAPAPAGDAAAAPGCPR